MEVAHPPFSAVALFRIWTELGWLTPDDMPHIFQHQTGVHAGQRVVVIPPYPPPYALVGLQWLFVYGLSANGKLRTARSGHAFREWFSREELLPRCSVHAFNLPVPVVVTDLGHYLRPRAVH